MTCLAPNKPKGVIALVYFDHWDHFKCFELTPEDSETQKTFGRADRSFGDMFNLNYAQRDPVKPHLTRG